MFDAARWAPSAFNSQPWRFLYAHRGDAHWDRFLGLLVPFNQDWARHAAVLVYILSDRLPFTDKAGAPAPSLTHSFDAGAAWALLALQAWRLGYFAHGMSGIELDRARKSWNPDRYGSKPQPRSATRDRPSFRELRGARSRAAPPLAGRCSTALSPADRKHGGRTAGRDGAESASAGAVGFGVAVNG